MIKIDFHPSARILRQFAWVALFAFPLLALLLHWKWDLPWVWCWIMFGFGAVVFACGVLLDAIVVPRLTFIGLSVVSVPIGMVLSWVLVRLIYYGMFMPIAAVFRLIGRDAMRRKMDPGQASYWVDRGPPREPASYFKLY
jgi:hypothetical protein